MKTHEVELTVPLQLILALRVKAFLFLQSKQEKNPLMMEMSIRILLRIIAFWPFQVIPWLMSL